MNEEELVSVAFVCPMCGKEHYLDNIPRSLVNRIIARKESGEYIQDILKDFSSTDREKFITGYCDECQKLIFGTAEEWLQYFVLTIKDNTLKKYLTVIGKQEYLF